MGRVFHLRAAAKVNLHLHILGGLRSDGFHELRSIFHGIDLWDDIHFRVRPRGESHKLAGNFDCSPGENLILRSIRLFLDKTGARDVFFITLQKRIPSGAGLGGGSSDAAATLRGLNHFYGSPLSQEQLADLGAELGSDVPFFLGDSTAAFVTGRGERLSPLPPLKGLILLLVTPDLSISTGEAFRWFDQDGGDPRTMEEEEARTLYGDYSREDWPFFNSFTSSLFRRFPLLREIHEKIAEAKGLYTGMSGSGSSLFGIFKDPTSAERGYRALKRSFKRIWKIKLLAQWEPPYRKEGREFKKSVTF